MAKDKNVKRAIAKIRKPLAKTKVEDLERLLKGTIKNEFQIDFIEVSKGFIYNASVGIARMALVSIIWPDSNSGSITYLQITHSRDVENILIDYSVSFDRSYFDSFEKDAGKQEKFLRSAEEIFDRWVK